MKKVLLQNKQKNSERTDKTANIPSVSMRRRKLLIDLFLVLLTIPVYFQVIHHNFVNYDDDLYVTRNEMVQSGISSQGLVWAFTTGDVSNWHPSTWLSHMVVSQFFGLDPAAHHLASLLLHLASTLLLFHLFLRMTRAPWQSAFVAALFAVHPLNVESVAWVAERKGALCTLFWMLTMWSYLLYTERWKIGPYLLVLVFFAMGCMAKPMIVTLPFALLLIDYWPLARFSQERRMKDRKRSPVLWAVLEKIPLFVLAGIMTAVGFFAQQSGGALLSFETLPLKERLSNALISYVIYLYRAFWPQDLAVFYPFRNDPLWQVGGAFLLLAFISAAAILFRKQKPYLPAGWFWYLGTFIPVIQIVQIGHHAMADRYAYIPMIGIFAVMAWGIPDILKGFKYRQQALITMGGLTILVLSITSWYQVSHWKNSYTLFEHALKAVPNNYVANNGLGRALHSDGKAEQAIGRYEKALRMEPRYTDARYNLARSLASLGRIDEAVSHYQEALRRRPDFEEAHLNLGTILAHRGDMTGAIHHYSEALRLRPQYAMAHFNLANALVKDGRTDEAIEHYREALRIKPRYAEAHYNLGNALAQQGRIESAVAHYMEALRITPTFMEAHINIGNLLSRKGKLEEAISHYREILRVKPDHAKAHYNLARALSEQGKIEEAVPHYLETIRVSPDNPHAHYYLGNALSRNGQTDEAIRHYGKALAAAPDFVEVRINLGAELARQDKMEEALEQYNEAIRINPDCRPYVYYNIACLYALKKSVKESVMFLKKAVEAGFNDWEHIETDSDLENIRSSSFYKELIRGR